VEIRPHPSSGVDVFENLGAERAAGLMRFDRARKVSPERAKRLDLDRGSFTSRAYCTNRHASRRGSRMSSKQYHEPILLYSQVALDRHPSRQRQSPGPTRIVAAAHQGAQASSRRCLLSVSRQMDGSANTVLSAGVHGRGNARPCCGRSFLPANIDHLSCSRSAGRIDRITIG